MDYSIKLNKYILKYQYITNLKGGHVYCDATMQSNHIDAIYVKDTTNLIPFTKSIYHPFRSHPICSYSVWNKSKTELYIPTPPTIDDKVFKYLDYHIRPYKVYFEEYDSDRLIESSMYDILLWSEKHNKWYLLLSYPDDDNTLEKLSKDMNLDIYLGSDVEPKIDTDLRLEISFKMQFSLINFLVFKNYIIPASPTDYNIPNLIIELLDNALSYNKHNAIKFNYASPKYIDELNELNELYNK